MRRGSVKALALSVLWACLLTACGGDRGETASIFAMDTVMDVTAYGEDAQEAVDAAVAELNRLDRMLSAQKEGSQVWDINHGQWGLQYMSTGETEVSRLLANALLLCGDTDGALDITIYPAMEAWGFYEKDYRVPSDEELENLRALVDYQTIGLDATGVTDPGRGIDLGAVGKGYAADRVVELWCEMGVTSGLLNLGGNVQCVGAKPDGSDWSVGVRDPEDENGTLCTVSGRDMAVVTSGAYQRNFEVDGVMYHHILDPKTCMPAHSGLASVTIVAQSGFLADGLSTAVYVMGLDRAVEFWREYSELAASDPCPDRYGPSALYPRCTRQSFDMILYTDDHELYITPGLADRVEASEGLRPQVLDG